MRKVLLRAALAAIALAPGCGGAEAADGPKKPEAPFTIHLFTQMTDKDAVDSTNDVRKVLEEKKRDWFQLTLNRAEADIVLEITGRSLSSDNAYVVRGRVTTANTANAEIIGQCIPGVLDMHKPWRSAAEDMAKRLETFCRKTYADLAEAHRKRAKASTP